MPCPFGGSSKTLPAAVRRRDGLDPLAAMRFEILAAEITAVAAHALLDRGRDRARRRTPARPSAAMSSYARARLGFANGSPLAGARPARHEDFREAGRSPCSAAAPASQAAPMTSVTGKPSRAYSIDGASRSRSGKRPKRACSSHQPSTAPGTLTASGPRSGISVCPMRARCSSVSDRGEAAARVQAVQALARGIPDDREQVAADAAARRLDEAERGVRGDGGVDGAAAAAQRGDADLGGERLARRDHAVPRHDDGASREAVGGSRLTRAF